MQWNRVPDIKVVYVKKNADLTKTYSINDVGRLGDGKVESYLFIYPNGTLTEKYPILGSHYTAAHSLVIKSL